jgi:hypothetical protein
LLNPDGFNVGTKLTVTALVPADEPCLSAEPVEIQVYEKA